MKIENISDVDLNDPEVLRECLSLWNVIVDLSYEYPKVRDLKIEIQQRWNKANLDKPHKEALYYNLIEDQTLKATSKKMRTGVRWVKRIVQEGLTDMAEVKLNDIE